MRTKNIGLMVGLLAAALVTLAAAGLPHTEAAPLRQGGGELVLFAEPLSGSLDAGAAGQTYSFECASGMVLSVVATTVSGDLVPQLTVLDAAGRTLAEGVSMRQGIAAEAFIPPSDGLCSAIVSRASGSGTYQIRLLGGFANLTVQDRFDGSGGALSLPWAPYSGTGVEIDIVNGQMQIAITSENTVAWNYPDDEALSWSDFYVQADITVEGTPSYAEYGFLFHMDSEAGTFYSLSFSSDGDYGVYSYTDQWNPIQEWTVSPAVDGSDTSPQIAAFVQNGTLRAYFNGAFVGKISLGDTLPPAGTLSIVAGTLTGQTGGLTVDFDNLTITTPGEPGESIATPPFGVGGQASPTPGGLLQFLGATSTAAAVQPSATPRPPTPRPPTPVPQAPTNTPASTTPSLTSWNSNRPQDIVAELQQMGLAPSSGSLTLNIPTSFGDTASAGWHFYPLGRGRTFRNFVLAFDARLLNTGPGSGCGMHFRDNNQSVSSATIFEDGSALLGQFDANGDLHDSSIFKDFDAVISGQGATNRVVVIAIEDAMGMFINGEFFGSGSFTAQTGEMALEVFVAKDNLGQTQQTYCQLDNIWVWEF